MRTFKELLDRIAAVQGVPFLELAQAHGITWTQEPKRNKGVGGRIVEAAMGLPVNVRPEPDLSYLGLEIKSIPLGLDLSVQERTKLTMFNFQDIHDHEWDRSTVAYKLRSILFVPVVKGEDPLPDRWYIRAPFIWFPSLKAQEQFAEDYGTIRTLLVAGKPEALSSKQPPKGQGKFLISSTAGEGDVENVGRGRTAYEWQGGRLEPKKRSWMLRKEFTQAIIEENVRYRRPAGDEAAKVVAPPTP